jgi:hypothetical protein
MPKMGFAFPVKGGTFTLQCVWASMVPDALKSNFTWAYAVAPQAKIRSAAKDITVNFLISFPPL